MRLMCAIWLNFNVNRLFFYGKKLCKTNRYWIYRKDTVFELCYVLHDEFLNDIDDAAANDLARRLTKNGCFCLFRNHIR
jgi:hypothetical protein